MSSSSSAETNNIPLETMSTEKRPSVSGSDTTLNHSPELQNDAQDAHGTATFENEAPSRRSMASSATAVRPQVAPAPPTTRLPRSKFILIPVLIYVGLAIFAWVVICILTKRPITGPPNYDISGVDNNRFSYEYSETGTIDIGKLYTSTKTWYRAANVIQSIVSIMTIPLTTAVCSNAAVVFVQRAHPSFHLSIRQVLSLADRSWSDPTTYPRILRYWKRFGTSFLLIAIFLSILGAVISPLQALLVSVHTIKTPLTHSIIRGLIDLPDMWQPTYEQGGDDDDNNIVISIRNILSAASSSNYQGNLWQNTPGASCGPQHLYDGPIGPCQAGVTLGDIASRSDSFFAKLPNGFNTGLTQQYLSRINSSANYVTISADEFPRHCDQLPGAFFAEYSALETYQYESNEAQLEKAWSLVACMPANQMQSPWQPIRNRQDFSEVLYVNFTGQEGVEYDGVHNGTALFRLTLDTTAGYFELPNYKNGGLPGPLLLADPIGIYSQNVTGNYKRDYRVQNVTSSTSNSSLVLERLPNKGPLLVTAMALFGEGSYLADRIAHPEAYITANRTLDTATDDDSTNEYSCIDTPPFIGLLGETARTIGACTRISDVTDETSLNDQLALWASLFAGKDYTIANAFTQAAFLANQAWMNSLVKAGGEGTLEVTYDLGADTKIPAVSMASMIAISVLLGIQLFLLLVLALYASFYRRWTRKLDAFAMLRLGAAMGDHIPLQVGWRKDLIEVLDDMPGWVGDASEDHGQVGRLGLGAAKLDTAKKYECYPGNRQETQNYRA